MIETEEKKMLESAIEIIELGKNRILDSINQINTSQLDMYWNLGKTIYEKQGKQSKAGYGENIIINLSKELVTLYGKGFSKRNLERMRNFYLIFPIASPVTQLTWTHILLLLPIKEEKKRNFYIECCIRARWSKRELERQIKTHFYERILSTQNAIPIINSQGYNIKDYIRSEYILDFLSNPKNEKELEDSIFKNLKTMFLELGTGFSYKGRQEKIRISNINYYVDLVFYNDELKCYFLLELKKRKIKKEDYAQIKLYTKYYDDFVKRENDNPTIGIVLSERSGEIFTYINESDNIYSSRYLDYMPSKEEFQRLIFLKSLYVKF